MELLKAIPQAFFEFFARVIPGAVLLVALIIAKPDPADAWYQLLNSSVAGYLDKDNSLAVAMTVGLMSSYVLGQLLAPFGKLLQRIAEVLARVQKKDIKGSGDYDWLRAHKSDQGALVAKIRGESTMFYSIAAAAVIVLVFAGFQQIAKQQTGWSIGKSILAVVLLISGMVRGHSTNRTCKETARKLRSAYEEKLSDSTTGYVR